MKTVSPSARIKEIFSAPSLPVTTVITSPDTVRRNRALQFIVTQLTNRNLSFKSFTFSDMHKENVRVFLSELQEPSLFQPQQIGFLKNIEKAKAADIEPVTKCLGQLPSGVSLILTGADLPNSQSFKKAVSAYHLAFEPLKGAELRRWTEREFSLQGIEGATDPIVEYLLAVTEEQPDAVSAALEKYSLFLDGEQASLNSLQNLFPAHIQANDFELAESILNQSPAKTEVLLQRLLSQGSSPFMLLGLLGKTWTSFHGIAALQQKGLSGNEIRTQLGLSPWLFNKYLPLTKRLSPHSTSAGIEALLRADFRLKDRSLGADVIFSDIAQQLKCLQK